MSGAVVLLLAESLAILALLAFALSVVGFLIQTSRHKPTRGWSLPAVATLVLLLVFGSLSNAVSRQSAQTLTGDQPSASNAMGSEDYDATVKVTSVVDGDTIDISPSVKGRSRVRLIGMDTPKVCFGTQPYGQEASAFAKQELDGEEVRLELAVQKVDPYGRLLAYVYLPNGEMFNETLLEEGYAQVATFPPNVKYVDRFLEAQREARAANRGPRGLSAGELCQQTDRGNGIGGGCSGSEPQSQPDNQSASAGSAQDSDLDCASFDTHEQPQRVLEQDRSDRNYLDSDGDGVACEELLP
jgi:micrococcal nuclease